MSDLNEIKSRLKSVEQTRQITNAMYLLSVSRMKRAIFMAENASALYAGIKSAVADLVSLIRDDKRASKLMRKDKEGKKLYAVLMSDRGLCGSFNNEIACFVRETANVDDDLIYCFGTRGAKALKARKITADRIEKLNARGNFSDAAAKIAETLFTAYNDISVSEIDLIYYDREKRHPTVFPFLPVDVVRTESTEMPSHTVFEPSITEAAERMISFYCGAMIKNAIINTVICENTARTEAMQNATSNADDMMSDLETQLYLLRQQIITNEIAETAAATENLNGC